MKKFYFLLFTSILFLTVTKHVFSEEKNIFPKKKPILVTEIKEKKVSKNILLPLKKPVKKDKKEIKKDETVKEIKKHFPNAEVVPYFGDVKYFKDLNDGEQKVVSEEDFITTMKGFVELSGNDYDKAIELWELNKELFDLYKEKDSEKH